MAKSKDKRLSVAEHMPPLRRTQPETEYDTEKDEVLKWVSSQPGLVGFLVSKLKDWGYIHYDPETHTWKGVGYESD